MVAAEQAREDIARARAEWRDGMTALDPSKLVFIDESGVDTKMTRRFGRAARGVPCVGSVRHGHWRNTTFIAGLRNDRIDAPMLIEAAMDGEAFCAWVERMLAPTLSAGDIVRRGNDPPDRFLILLIGSAAARCAKPWVPPSHMP